MRSQDPRSEIHGYTNLTIQERATPREKQRTLGIDATLHASEEGQECMHTVHEGADEDCSRIRNMRERLGHMEHAMAMCWPHVHQG